MAMQRKRIGFTLVEILVSILFGVVHVCCPMTSSPVFESYHSTRTSGGKAGRGHIASLRYNFLFPERPSVFRRGNGFSERLFR